MHTRGIAAATFLLSSAVCASALAQSADTPPSTPVGLTATVYGPTAGAIAWQRSTDDRGVRGYEITRNGVVIGTLDALSYVDDTRRAGTTTAYSVAAIDTAGQRSGRADVTLTTLDLLPESPKNLTAHVYSNTAAGIRWDRSGVVGERYEVRRDGEVVALTDGTTHVDLSLSPRRRYGFTVGAINRQGLRSRAVGVDVVTSVEPPEAPVGLRATVYSPSAAGIAWDAPPPPITFSDVIGYEVSRDGEVVAASQGGRSYIDDLLRGGTTYVYSVVAVNARGQRSGRSTISVTTPLGASPTYDEAPAHVQVRLAVVFYVMNGNAIRAAIGAGKNVYRQLGTERYPQTATTVDPVTSLGRTEHRCPGGGIAATRRYEIDGADDNPQTALLLEDCDTGNDLVTATYEGGTLEENRIGYPADGVPPAYAESDIGLPREITRFRSRNDFLDDDTYDVRGWLRVDLDEIAGVHVTHVQQIGTDRTGTGSHPTSVTTSVGGEGTVTTVTRGADGRSFGSETVTDLVMAFAGVDGDVTVSTPQPLYKDTARRDRPTRGQLQVSGVGFRYLLDADTGSERTYHVTVTENGSTMTYAALWSGIGAIDSRPY